MMTNLVEYKKQGTVGLIALNNPPVNALARPVRQAILSSLQQAIDDSNIKAIVLIGRGRCFSGGADIREFSEPAKHTEHMLPQVIERIENSPKPVVAALHSTAFGGGMELALGCHYRIGAPSTRLAQPEVKLGIIPGAGGTQRLPRLIGMEPALEMILSGEPVTAEQALSLGLLDAVVDGELESAAIAFAEKLLAEKHPLRRARDMDEKLRAAGDVTALIAKIRKSIERRARGLLAPFLCIDSVANAIKLPFDEGLKRERELFVRCRDSEQSKAQRYAFFAERQASKIPDVPADTPVPLVQQAAVIGAGTMGGGIAMNFANADIPVQVLEVSQAALDKGLAVVRKNYSASVTKGRLAQADMDARMALISGRLDYTDIADADVVIEAVFEDMGLKKEIFEKLGCVCKAQAILQHLDPRRQRDRCGQRAPATSDRHALLQPGQRDATHGECAWCTNLERNHRCHHASVQAARQGRRAGRCVRWLCRQPHVPRLHEAGELLAGRRCAATAGGQGDL
jgi:3-hydroxyacyl-CoA dehydrogenase